MPEWWMAEVMRQCQCFREILVKAQLPRHSACDLSNFQRMREARAIVIALVIHEHLRLVREPAECTRVNDPIAITLIFRSRRTSRLPVLPSSSRDNACGIGREPTFTGRQVRAILMLRGIRAGDSTRHCVMHHIDVFQNIDVFQTAGRLATIDNARTTPMS